jgi:hypothetical protein
MMGVYFAATGLKTKLQVSLENQSSLEEYTVFLEY